MGEAVIVEAVRTPLGKRDGMLAHWHPVDLMAETMNALLERVGPVLEPGAVDDVILGCVMQVGEQSTNLARNAVLSAGWPDRVPGTTIDRQCGSGQQAIHFAAQAVMAGAADVIVAGGVESMTRVPMGAPMVNGQYGFPFGQRMNVRYAEAGGLVSQGIAAELVADEWGITREDMDEYALGSQERARRATADGRFDAEIVPVTDAAGEPLFHDEGIRPTTRAGLAALTPAFVPAAEGGRVTAGNASQITDGAAATLVMSRHRAESLGLRPRARFVSFAVAGDDPRLMLTAAIPTTFAVLERAGLTLDDIDLFEVNEAFASAVLAWLRDVPVDTGRLNVNGGAIALGHPLGATGAADGDLLHELERRRGRYGLQVMCEGGGIANAMVIERLP